MLQQQTPHSTGQSCTVSCTVQPTEGDGSQESAPSLHSAPNDVTLLLAPSQVARMLEMSAREVDQLAAGGELPVAGRTPGGHRRYSLNDVSSLKEQRSNHTGEDDVA